MIMGEREGLLARIRQVRRSGPGADGSDQRSTVATRDDRMPQLEARIAHLERLVEGLQDSVHRESERHETLIADLQAQIQPSVMGAALAEDARSRGL
jgi:uncharacterized coiled-coil protein SlyX